MKRLAGSRSPLLAFGNRTASNVMQTMAGHFGRIRALDIPIAEWGNTPSPLAG